MTAATAGVHTPHHFVRLNKQHREDLLVWEMFLNEYNGQSLWMEVAVSNSDLDLYMDTAGSVGYAAYFQGQWSAGRWPEAWSDSEFIHNLVLLELFPIVVAVKIWGGAFRNKRVQFNCDNMGVVNANTISAPSPPVVRLLRRLVLQCLSLNDFVYAVHMPGVCNTVADALSHLQWERFHQLAPEAEADLIRQSVCPSICSGLAGMA